MEPYENKISIKNWAEDDRPREKLSTQGRRSLSDAELIAILIASGNRDESAVELSKRILHHYGNDLQKMGKVSIAELCKFKGIGEAKAISIIAALELGRRRDETEVKAPEIVTSSNAAWQYLKRYMVDLAHEEFWIVLIGRNNRILGKELISKGGLSATVADPRIIFHLAIQHQATSLILAHNHPSGNKKPSQQDIDLTKKLYAAGKLLDINIFDHIIVTDTGYFSFADEGLF
ncbi:RadC family protein [Mucilaginibacter ginkgonis]|uniref:DNA repair protein RadC n=1 Tax=Mucilaginibacter ginkgonis TaxID=2682091 RepID=A0A6I4HZT3_9SPHI|nr:DNA repair protein RadC [Mucilaginibacter ginkgonis]QQL50026.1 DNA repair protein RadC [Mucilaginibacter ginkgonis]